jgi:hypothetical protein
MKFFTIIAFLLCLEAIFSSLVFELKKGRPRCYVEELYDESVAMVKWKLSGLPEDQAKKQSNKI